LRNWPLSAVSVSTDLVQLRWPTLEQLDDLAARGAEGVHDRGYMPFFSAWTDGDAETVSRRVLQRHWGALAAWRPEDWTLYLVVLHQGVVVGSQSIGARDFATNREVVLTSWLATAVQGRGFGTHARAALLALAFAGLGADEALVVVRQDNVASQRLCEKFGFLRDGTQTNAVRGERVLSDRYRLSRDAWASKRWIDAAVADLTSSRALFGMSDSPNAPQTPTPRVLDSAALSGVFSLPEADHDLE
jgi:RimJ/RimL family protein N-acetyltransferase